jgi:hypothetical protein
VRPKGVVDGKLVNIPALFSNTMWGRRRLCTQGEWNTLFKRVARYVREIRRIVDVRRDEEVRMD